MFRSIQQTQAGKAAIDMRTNTPSVRVGDAVEYVFDVEDGSTINVWITNADLKCRLVAPADWKGPDYRVPWTVDVMPGTYTLIFEQRQHAAAVDRIEGHVVVAAAPVVAGPASNGTPGGLTPAGDTAGVPVDGHPIAPYMFGVCGLLTLRPETPIMSTLWDGTKRADEVVKAIGVEGTREWSDFVGNVGQDTARPNWDRFAQYRDASGLKRIVACLAHEGWKGRSMPTPETTAASIAAYLKSLPAWLTPDVLQFEVGNEFAYPFNPLAPEDDYWPGDVTQFVQRVLNPCYDVLNAAGYTVILGGLNGWSPDQLKAVIKAGGRFDVIGHHPYSPTPNEYETKTDLLTSIAPGKPIVETESNTHDGPGVKSGKTSVAAAVANQGAVDAVRRRKAAVTAAYEFSAECQTKTMTGPLGWFSMTRKGNVVIAATTSPLFDLRFATKFKATTEPAKA